MTNILEAIVNIANIANLEVNELTFGNNRATNVGDGLEVFVKDAFSDNLTTVDNAEKIVKYSQVFSY